MIRSLNGLDICLYPVLEDRLDILISEGNTVRALVQLSASDKDDLSREIGGEYYTKEDVDDAFDEGHQTGFAAHREKWIDDLRKIRDLMEGRIDEASEMLDDIIAFWGLEP